MKKIFILFTFLFSFLIFSQEFKFEEVVKVDSLVTKDELFNRARSWVGKNFNDEKDVIATEDRNNGEISGNGRVKYRTDKIYMGVVCVEGDVDFKLNIFVKEGRYKYVFDTFRHSGSSAMGSREINYGPLTNSKEAPEPSRGYGNNKAWKDIKEKTTERMNAVILSLQKGMNKKYEGSNDW